MDEDDPVVPPPLAMPTGHPASDLLNASTKSVLWASIQWAAYGVLLSAGFALTAIGVDPEIGAHVAIVLIAIMSISLLIGLVSGWFARHASKEEKARLDEALAREIARIQAECQTALDRNKEQIDAALQTAQSRVEEAVANTRLELLTALIGMWPLSRSVTVYRLCAPRVARDGEVIVNLRAVNQSPFIVTIHSPTFVPYSGQSGANVVSVVPIKARLGANGGTSDLTVTARFPSLAGLEPRLNQEPDGTTRERTIVHVSMRGHIIAARDDGSEVANISLLTDEGQGDAAQTVEITQVESLTWRTNP